jgi:hypothetical protein
MDFDDVFEAYYTQYRLEAEIPASTDDEYPIARRLCNEAINRWAGYDGTYWRELFTTLSLAGETQTIATATIEYSAPDDFKEAGGFLTLRDPDTNATVQRIPIIEPQDAQFKGDDSVYCFFTGDPSNGHTLHINPTPTAPLIGCTLDYVYYKKPTLMVDGSSATEMREPYFMVHRMLANRFRGSRNPYYGSAKTDAEDVLKTMKMTNDSGNWADPWKLPDNSGSSWGG